MPKNCTTYEKEAHVILKVFDKIDLILWDTAKGMSSQITATFYLFLHRSHCAQTQGTTYCQKSTDEQYTSVFSTFGIDHMDSVKNMCADLLTCWARGHRKNHVASGNVMVLCKRYLSSS